MTEDKKILMDMTDDQLINRMREMNVQYSYDDYNRELQRRSQDRHTRAMNLLTLVIAIATVVQMVLGILSYFKMHSRFIEEMTDVELSYWRACCLPSFCGGGRVLFLISEP